MIDQRNPGNLPFSHLNYKDLRDQNQVFSGMAAFAFAQVNWSSGTESEQIPLQVVSGNYFSLLGVEPALGRGVRAEEDEKPTPVVVVSHGFWERSLGSDPAIVGKTLTLNRTPFTVIGVARRGFTGTLLGGGPSVWVPMSMHDVVQPNFTGTSSGAGSSCSRSAGWRRTSRSSRRQPTCRRSSRQLEQAFPNDNKGRSAGAVPLLEARLNPQGRRRRRRRGQISMHPDDGRRHRAADRLREHRQPAARARQRRGARRSPCGWRSAPAAAGWSVSC